MSGRHARSRWIADRIPRSTDVPWGYYKIASTPWTTWTFVWGRWEYYIARRDAPAGRRFP